MELYPSRTPSHASHILSPVDVSHTWLFYPCAFSLVRKFSLVPQAVRPMDQCPQSWSRIKLGPNSFLKGQHCKRQAYGNSYTNFFTQATDGPDGVVAVVGFARKGQMTNEVSGDCKDQLHQTAFGGFGPVAEALGSRRVANDTQTHMREAHGLRPTPRSRCLLSR